MFTSTRSQTVHLMILLTTSVCLAAPASGAQRGWAKVQDGTLVADNGELLRGIFFDPDTTGASGTPTEADLRLMRESGFNTLHVYAERDCSGSQTSRIDTLKNFTKNNGLYMVLTVGQVCSPTEIDLSPGSSSIDYERTAYDHAFNVTFWNKYAPRYMNETHVIYELINEPWWIFHVNTLYSQGYPTQLINDEADLYQLVRKQAGNTPILIFTYAGFNNQKAPEQSCCPSVLNDWNALNARLATLPEGYQLRPTTKDAVAFHTYYSGTVDQIKTVTQTVRNQGIPIINIEVERDDLVSACGSAAAKPCLREAQHEMYEKEGISNVSFLKAKQDLGNSTHWDLRVRGQLEGNNGAPPALIWVPDHPPATWPVQRAPSSWCNQDLHLQLVNNNKFVQLGSDSKLYANASSMSNATRFRVVCQTNGKVRLKAMSNNKYVDPGVTSQSSALVASVISPNSNHEFDLLLRENGTLILRSLFPSGHPGWRIVSVNTSSNQLFDNQTMLVDKARFNWYLTGSSSCVAGTDVLCLNNNRFEVRLKYFNAGTSGQGRGTMHPTTNTTGYFWFFNSTNLEVGVKVLDGSEINGNYWVYHGAITLLDYTLTLRDTVKNVIKSYQKTGTNLCGGGDIGAFPKSLSMEQTVPSFRDSFEASETGPRLALAKALCSPGATHSCLLGNRFKVVVNQSGAAKPAIKLNDETGSVWFYSADNPEVFVKVLDGRAINGKFWVLFGSMTGEPYEVVVTDTVANTTKTYYPPPPLSSLCGDSDFLAF